MALDNVIHSADVNNKYNFSWNCNIIKIITVEINIEQLC